MVRRKGPKYPFLITAHIIVVEQFLENNVLKLYCALLADRSLLWQSFVVCVYLIMGKKELSLCLRSRYFVIICSRLILHAFLRQILAFRLRFLGRFVKKIKQSYSSLIFKIRSLFFVDKPHIRASSQNVVAFLTQSTYSLKTWR